MLVIIYFHFTSYSIWWYFDEINVGAEADTEKLKFSEQIDTKVNKANSVIRVINML